MKKKSSGAEKRHVVAWMNKAEWDQVLEYLYSSESSRQKYALHRISAWKSRYGHSTPVAVDCTADLVRCQVQDRSGQQQSPDLVLGYGMALVRFVNLITERQQGRVARSLRRLADKLNIAEWIVNLRHECTHKKLPTLKWCRKGCQAALDWLWKEYWSRQLGGSGGGDWGEEEDDEAEDDGARQKEMETYKKTRELLISYEKEQYAAQEGDCNNKEKWPAPFAEMSWILGEIKETAQDSSEILIDTLLEDGFLVPTSEQLQTLGCKADFDPSDANPQVPQIFLRFWLPLLRTLNSLAFIHLFLEKLFAELKLLSDEPNERRTFYVSAWISEVILCNAKPSDFHYETKNQRKARLKDQFFVNRVPLRWQQLLSACLESPCVYTPRLLKLILADMDHPLPSETQDNLLSLCSIYTRNQGSSQQQQSGPPRRDQPIYTLESLHEKLRRSRHRRGKEAERSGSSREMSDTDADKMRLLRGSPWQLCTENIAWKNYPLGKVPGQSDDPNCLMLENYTLMEVSDQPVETETPIHSQTKAATAVKSEGLVWNPNDLARLKSGMKLF